MDSLDTTTDGFGSAVGITYTHHTNHGKRLNEQGARRITQHALAEPPHAPVSSTWRSFQYSDAQLPPNTMISRPTTVEVWPARRPGVEPMRRTVDSASSSLGFAEPTLGLGAMVGPGTMPSSTPPSLEAAGAQRGVVEPAPAPPAPPDFAVCA